MIKMLGFVFAVNCVTPVFADDRRVAFLAASIDLAQRGIETGSVTPVMLAREMLANISPSGAVAERLDATWAQEARFFARGNPEILARIDKAAKSEVDPNLTVYDASSRLVLPTGHGATVMAVAGQARLDRVAAKGVEVCKPDAEKSLWICDPENARDVLELDVQLGAGASFVVIGLDGGP